MRRTAAIGAAWAIALASPALAKDPPAALQQQVEAALGAAVPGARFGLVAATADGRELIAIAPDARFMPASNMKILTTAAAFATLPGMTAPDLAGGTSVALERGRRKRPDVVLAGRGDARLSSRPDCVTDCLAALADAVVAARVRAVGDVIGDATFFPDERWSPGMSWNNLHSRSGTAVAALSLDDNELTVRVTPGAAGAPPRIDMLPYYRVDNRAVTTSAGETKLELARLPGARVIEIRGRIAVGAPPANLVASIDDPAHYAAWRLKALLEARGVRVRGEVRTRYRPPPLEGEAGDAEPAPAAAPLARLVPPPLLDDVARINKSSQNLHAELLLRRVGRVAGGGSIADGTAAVGRVLERAGVPRVAYDLADGSGMSTYNRVSPRGMLAFLRWVAAQPWGAAWRDTLPIGGIDGTLARRFRATALAGRVRAKTGSLNATSALSGTMIARSGQILYFAAFANDVPQDAGASRAIDAALLLIAGAN